MTNLNHRIGCVWKPGFVKSGHIRMANQILSLIYGTVVTIHRMTAWALACEYGLVVHILSLAIRLLAHFLAAS